MNADMRRFLRRPGLAALLVLATLPLPLASFTSAADPVPRDSIQVTIDYGDGVQKRIGNLAWQDGMTVMDAMQAAQRHPRGIRMMVRGSGATAFLFQIDDLKNEGQGRNWLFEVNGKLSDRSLGVYKLRAGDRVDWEFREYEP